MRLLSKFVLTLVLIVVISLTTLIGLLHTRYNEHIFNFILAQVSPYQIFAKKLITIFVLLTKYALNMLKLRSMSKYSFMLTAFNYGYQNKV